MTVTTNPRFRSVSESEYKRRIWAWTMYDWANSAFATTIMAVVLPVYFSSVAGANLPSATVATTYWSYGLSLSLLIIAVLSPILGTLSDVTRGKKRFLAVFAGLGVVATALLVLVETGDWVLASVLAIVGRIGFSGSIIFYDAMLPHVAREEDQNQVSARGYAMGYLGGGLLLAINIVMIQLLPGTWGARLSFLSVAIWWALFSIPLFRRVPEPAAAAVHLAPGEGVVGASFRRMLDTLKDIRQYSELFKYLLAFLIYNDGIGTIINLAAIYGAELGIGSVELILALLLVQFVGIPYSLIFGRLPSENNRRRPVYLAFVLFNLAALPVVAMVGARTLPVDISGARSAAFPAVGNAVGEGEYLGQTDALQFSGVWQPTTISAEQIGGDTPASYFTTNAADARMDFPYNGQNVEVVYSQGPDQGIWAVLVDGQPVTDPDTLEPLQIDAYAPQPRYDVRQTIRVETPGQHQLTLVPTGERNPDSQGTAFTLGGIRVLQAERRSNLGLILGLILGVEAVGLALAFLLGPVLFSRWVHLLTTKRSILLSLVIYSVIAILGFFVNSVLEFWCLAWMVAVVQGGSQALSRSLYAAMSPAAKSGEFFGLFGVMEKFSAIIGPLMFAAAGVLFGSSRPAVLSVVVLFIIGGALLTKVNVAEGRRVAQEEDAALLQDTL